MKSVKWSAMAVLAIIMLGCSSSAKETISELEKLCQKDAGLSVYKKVEASGYYDAITNCSSCWNKLIDSDYKFIEFCKLEQTVVSMFDGVGCWRVSRSVKGSDACDKKINESIANNKWSSQEDFRKSSCISISKIEEVEATYKVNFEKTEMYRSNDDKNYITRLLWSFHNKDSGEKIAEQNEYVASIYNNIAGVSSGTYCDRFENGFRSKKGFIEKVIIPNLENIGKEI